MLPSTRPFRTLGAALCTALLAAACASPRLQDPGPQPQPARLAAGAAVMDDGYRLPLRHWGRPEQARAVALALHGFNDYSNAFAGLGDFLGERDVSVYAYDQRGFGRTAQRGRWAGHARLVADLHRVLALLRARHPGLPLYLIGESMGGAVALAAAPELGDLAGVILIAPAVWSRDRMPAAQRWLLAASTRTLPGLKLTGRGLAIRPTDNDPAWRRFSADPLVIKGTRVDALWGVTNLMDAATAGAPALRLPTLVLYGYNDRIIPRHAFCTTLAALPGTDGGPRVALYPRGWHMLARDLQGAWVLADIAAWIDDPSAPLPSGQGHSADAPPIRAFCADG